MKLLEIFLPESLVKAIMNVLEIQHIGLPFSAIDIVVVGSLQLGSLVSSARVFGLFVVTMLLRSTYLAKHVALQCL